MEILHFPAFVSQCSNQYLNDTPKHEVTQTILDAPHMLTDTSNEILDSYREYTEHTRNGTHGQTAQYWIGYIDMVHLYHEFSRSIRTGDLQLYIHCMPKLGNYYFAFNHFNYARWIVKFHGNLMRLEYLTQSYM